MIPARHSSNLPRGLSYPVGADALGNPAGDMSKLRPICSLLLMVAGWAMLGGFARLNSPEPPV
jgi:hypothetical protein